MLKDSSCWGLGHIYGVGMEPESTKTTRASPLDLTLLNSAPDTTFSWETHLVSPSQSLDMIQMGRVCLVFTSYCSTGLPRSSPTDVGCCIPQNHPESPPWTGSTLPPHPAGRPHGCRAPPHNAVGPRLHSLAGAGPSPWPELASQGLFQGEWQEALQETPHLCGLDAGPGQQHSRPSVRTWKWGKDRVRPGKRERWAPLEGVSESP